MARSNPVLTPQCELSEMNLAVGATLKAHVMVSIRVHTMNGSELVLEAAKGKRLMEVIRDNNGPIRAECGGVCACATCHVYVSPKWIALLPPPDENESALLEVVVEPSERSRLSCQILITDEMDGMEVWLAPGSS